MTLASGIYDFSPEIYHSDPCDLPSLSSSGIKRLLSGSPAEFAVMHSERLAQMVFGETDGKRWHEEMKESSGAMDDGTIAHAKVLGTACEFWAMDPEDCPLRTKKGDPYHTWSGDAAKWKKQHEAEGVIFTSRTKLADIQEAVNSMDRLIRKTYGDWLSLGKAEQTFIWQRSTAHGPIWCRAMLDYHSLQQLLILDPKFTNLGLSDRAIQKKIADERLDIQQVFYTEAVETFAPKLKGRLTFRFPIAQLNPPFDSRWIDLDRDGPDWLPEARKDVAEAADKFAECLYSGVWPRYDESCSPRRPQWMVAQSENRDLAEMESRLEMR